VAQWIEKPEVGSQISSQDGPPLDTVLLRVMAVAWVEIQVEAAEGDLAAGFVAMIPHKGGPGRRRRPFRHAVCHQEHAEDHVHAVELPGALVVMRPGPRGRSM